MGRVGGGGIIYREGEAAGRWVGWRKEMGGGRGEGLEGQEGRRQARREGGIQGYNFSDGPASLSGSRAGNSVISDSVILSLIAIFGALRWTFHIRSPRSHNVSRC